MSRNFGLPSFVPSNHRSKWPVIQYQSRRWANVVLEFSFKGVNPRNPEVKYYRCLSCHRLSKKKDSGEKIPIAHLTLENGAMMTDPDYPATPHSCHPEIDAPVAKVLANRFMMEVRTEIRQNRKRPRESFDNAVLSVEERFSEHTSEVQEAVRGEMVTGYGFASKRRALSRNRQFSVLKGNTVDTILPELQITKGLRPFLQLQDNTDGRRMLIFFADKDLDALQNAQYVLGDGNFKYNSKEFHNPGQLYTLHAVVNGEAQPIVYALMQALDVRAYEVLLTCLKDAMIRRFGIIGALATTTTWIFDYEAAVIIATKNVFSTTSSTPKVSPFFCSNVKKKHPCISA